MASDLKNRDKRNLLAQKCSSIFLLLVPERHILFKDVVV